jgi:hypothetical protein
VTSLFTSSPSSNSSVKPQTQAKLPGSRFGTLKPSELPSPNGGLKLSADVKKRDAVREAFEWSWKPYEQYAWGDDEVS